MIELEKKVLEKLKNVLKEDDVFWNNEIRANLFVSFCMLLLCIVLIITLFLSEIDVFVVPKNQTRVLCVSLIALLIISMHITRVLQGSTKWLKVYLSVVMIFSAFSIASILNIFTGYILLVPVILSVRYYSAKFTRLISAISGISLFLTEILFSRVGIINLNLVPVKSGTVLNITDNLRSAIDISMFDYSEYLSSLLRGSFAPRFLIFIIISLICVELAKKAHETVLEQDAINKRTEAVKAELDMARSIQNSALHKLFPAFPTHPEIDIIASMTPAKEVGGDFYDFYLLDESHLCVVIADVSGKGVPAALFMMVAKTLIKNEAFNTLSPKEIAKKVNNALCDGNDAQMFVTVWLGILDLKTGELTAVNAGHENPVIRRNGEDYKIFKDRHGFVLGGMEDMNYKEYTITLEPGDEMFLYTDGIPESTNSSKEQYGMKRLLDTLNSHKGAGCDEIIKIVKEDVDNFAKDEPQFDDLTMVSLKYIKRLED